MAAGSIIVDLLMRTGAFITDTDRAAKRLKQFQGEVLQAGKNIATGFGAVAAAVGAGVALVDRFATGIANFQDIADKIGDTASNVSRLQLAADQSETSLDTVAAASVKLSVALSKTDDEGSAASRALASLNIPLEEFNRLSPVEQLQRVAQEMSRFGSSAQKTAVAVALYGKSGAEIIPFLNDLADAQSKSAGLTEEQIEAADRFSKSLATARSQVLELTRAFVADLIPSLNDSLARINAAREQFGGLGGLLATGLAETLKGNVFFDAAEGVAFYTAKLKTLQQQREAIASNTNPLARRGGLIDVDAEIAQVQKLVGFYRSVNKQTAPDLGQADPRELARRGRTAAGFGSPIIPDKPDKKKEDNKQTEFDRYIDSLSRQLDRTNELTTAEQLLADIQFGRLGQVGIVQKEVLLGIAEEIDAVKRRKDQAEEEGRQLEGLRADRKALLAEGLKFYEETRTPQEELNAALAEQSRLLKALGPQYQETYERATAAARKAFDAQDEGLKRNKELAKELGLTFSSAAEDAIVNFEKLRDVLKGVLQDLLRILVRRSITNPLANAVGNFDFASFAASSAGGGIDYGDGSAFAGARATGGDVMENREYLVGEDGPERFRPRTAGTILPGSGGGNTIVHNYGADVRTEKRGNDTLVWINAAAELAYNRVAGDLASGTGRASGALRSRGVNMDRALPRRS